MVMVADPETFRVLPWAPHSGWILCDLYRTDGTPHPYSTRALMRRMLARLAERGFTWRAGLEVEFHLLKMQRWRRRRRTISRCRARRRTSRR